ncbi:hypothetical protein BpHYR1_047589 [Brachionus plicatilis]|uniref:Uncharacterized protein n=1 Tax=Brachionus plicatilis TaxID=10195 RepID=A0A3M7SQ75_BRAPC|nr:hypothetical protein BpHYR1_047589 [Brachionus plicatilis]
MLVDNKLVFCTLAFSWLGCESIFAHSYRITTASVRTKLIAVSLFFMNLKQDQPFRVNLNRVALGPNFLMNSSVLTLPN